jgi:hypothetical protein
MLSPAMKRKLPLSLPAVLAAALLPGTALVGCKSADTADSGATVESSDAVVGADASVEMVRSTPTEPLDKKEAGAATAMANAIAKKAEEKGGTVASTDDEAVKEPKKFRLFGGKKIKDKEEVATAATPEIAEAKVDESPATEVEPVVEPKRERKPLFRSRSKDKEKKEIAEVEGAAEPEVAAVKEKKKFRLFGFGKKKDKDADGEEVAADDALVAVNGNVEKEVQPVERGPKQLPWEESDPEFASNIDEELPDPEAFASFPDSAADAAEAAGGGTAARIRPGQSSGGYSPLDQTPDAASSVLDRVPSVAADSPTPAPRNDGFLPLTPEPKFPGEEGILPPGN